MAAPATPALSLAERKNMQEKANEDVRRRIAKETKERERIEAAAALARAELKNAIATIQRVCSGASPSRRVRLRAVRKLQTELEARAARIKILEDKLEEHEVALQDKLLRYRLWMDPYLPDKAGKTPASKTRFVARRW